LWQAQVSSIYKMLHVASVNQAIVKVVAIQIRSGFYGLQKVIMPAQ